jgi:hypothetical protein
MKIEIEDYRNWTIYFDTGVENFYCHSNQYDYQQTKQSFSACKKYIDDFLKDNTEFKPFWVESIPGGIGERLKIIGIRKDGRFMSEKPDGTKGQVSDFNLKRYMLLVDENKQYWDELQKKRQEIEELRLEEKAIYTKFKVKTLEQIKKEL